MPIFLLLYANLCKTIKIIETYKSIKRDGICDCLFVNRESGIKISCKLKLLNNCKCDI